MDDIIAQMPWKCDDNDCHHHWHLRSFWAYDDGTFSQDDFTDGDHENIDGDDVPTCDQINLSWRKYAEWVLENGVDPLKNYHIDTHKAVKAEYTVKLSKTTAGLRVVSWRRGHGKYQSGDPPKTMLDYINAKPFNGGTITDQETIATIIGFLVKNRLRLCFEEKRPVRTKTIRKKLVTAARKHLEAEK